MNSHKNNDLCCASFPTLNISAITILPLLGSAFSSLQPFARCSILVPPVRAGLNPTFTLIIRLYSSANRESKFSAVVALVLSTSSGQNFTVSRKISSVVAPSAAGFQLPLWYVPPRITVPSPRGITYFHAGLFTIVLLTAGASTRTTCPRIGCIFSSFTSDRYKLPNAEQFTISGTAFLVYRPAQLFEIPVSNSIPISQFEGISFFEMYLDPSSAVKYHCSLYSAAELKSTPLTRLMCESGCSSASFLNSKSVLSSICCRYVSSFVENGCQLAPANGLAHLLLPRSLLSTGTFAETIVT
ncbi:hypothetical protein AYI69_g2775 [Smittium culicis]|uniref:Uncharacterized protein n=1 Tax=Smittium culicis TaxID=133412 RepID=A0A1R1YLP3_9FUNG|nr:hypothetical protein AYI69_g2775 [Smittium culicis]